VEHLSFWDWCFTYHSCGTCSAFLSCTSTICC